MDMSPTDALAHSTLHTVTRLLAVVDTLVTLSPDERQELRMATWVYALSALFDALVEDATRTAHEEIAELTRWAALPTLHDTDAPSEAASS